MAITAVNRDFGSDNTPEVDTITNSVAFANSKLYLVSAYFRGGITPAISGITGGGITWVLEKSYQVGSPPAAFVFRGLVTSGATTEALTITNTGSPTSAKYSIDEFGGIDTSGTDGSGAIVQSAGNGGSAASGSITLASFADATNNAAYGVFGHSGNASEVTDVDTTPGAYTELSDNIDVVNPDMSMGVEWRIGEDTAVSASWFSDINWAGVAIELRAAAAGEPFRGTTPWISIGRSV